MFVNFKFRIKNENKTSNLSKTLILIYGSQGLNISIQIPESHLLTHHKFISKALNNLSLFQWGRNELNILTCYIFAAVVVLNYSLSWKPSRVQDPIWSPFNFTQQWTGKGSNLGYSVLNVAISFSCYNVKETMGINKKKQIYFLSLFLINQSRLKHNSQKPSVLQSQEYCGVVFSHLMQKQLEKASNRNTEISVLSQTISHFSTLPVSMTKVLCRSSHLFAFIKNFFSKN